MLPVRGSDRDATQVKSLLRRDNAWDGNTSELRVLVAGTDDMHDTFLCITAFALCFAFRRCENLGSLSVMPCLLTPYGAFLLENCEMGNRERDDCSCDGLTGRLGKRAVCF